MAKQRAKLTPTQYRESLAKLQKNKAAIQHRLRDDDRSYSLEGLRLAGLLQQMQSLQALQGLAELRPSEKKTHRYHFPADSNEREKKRQWLLFKSDWLEALLEETLHELQSLTEFEEGLELHKSKRKQSKLESRDHKQADKIQTTREDNDSSEVKSSDRLQPQTNREDDAANSKWLRKKRS
jgi:hypothetical protein